MNNDDRIKDEGINYGIHNSAKVSAAANKGYKNIGDKYMIKCCYQSLCRNG